MRYALFFVAHFILKISVPDDEFHIPEDTSPQALTAHDAFWRSVDIDARTSLKECRSSDVEPAAIAMFTYRLSAYSSSASSSQQPRCIGVIDEARALLKSTSDDGLGRTLSLFRLLRRAMTKLFEPMLALGCWFLLLDTTSTVSNFVPPADMDPSYRGDTIAAESEIRRLFPPFFNLPVLDQVDVGHLASISADLELRVFLRGRPLWQSYFINENMTTTTESVAFMLRKVIDVAKVKLLGGASDVLTFGALLGRHPLLVSAGCLAVCGNLVQCIEPLPSSAVSSQMLSSNMVRASS